MYLGALPPKRRLNRVFRDLIIGGPIFVGLMALGFLFDITERLIPWIQANESWEADEFVPALFFLAIGLAIFSYRRWREVLAAGARRRRAERALRESEASLRSVISSIDDWLMVINSEGVITGIHRSPLEHDPVMTEADYVGRTMASVVPAEVVTRLEEAIQRLAAQRETQHFDCSLKVKGQPTWFSITVTARWKENGDYAGATVVARDITKRKQAEADLTIHRDQLDEMVRERTQELTVLNQELINQVKESIRAKEIFQKSERRYRELFDSMHEGVGLVDINENIIFCNQAYADIFEEPSAEAMIGRNLKQYLPAEELAKVTAETARRVHGESSRYEVDILSAGGRRKTLLISVTPRIDSSNKVVGSYGAITDLTEMKRIQELTSRAMRLETAGRIASQVAHDFNNLLGPIMGYPGLMRESLPAEHPVLDYLQQIESSAQQIAEINQELLTLGRRGHYNLAPLDLNSLILREIRRIQPLPERLRLNLRLQDDLPNVKGGASQISRAVLNLVTNAIDAISGDGELTIATGNVKVGEGMPRIGTLEAGEYVHLAISDTGAGIPPDVLPQVMEPFFSTKAASRKRGSGLGLSVVHSVVEDHQGHIDIQSEVDRGTTVKLYFPTTREYCESDDNLPILGGSESVLVVDDDEVQRKVAGTLLAGLGYQSKSVSSGEEALEVIREKPPDLLILDMIMPGGMDGTETYQRVLESVPDQKAIIISGFAESERVETALRLGALEFVKKPLTRHALAAAVRRALDHKPALQESPSSP